MAMLSVGDDPEALLARADSLHHEKRFAALFDLVEPMAAAQPTNVDLAWRSARAHHDLAGELSDATRREQLLRDGLVIAERALGHHPHEGLCHKWVGILLGAVGEFLPTKEKVGNAFRIKERLLEAAQLRPDDSSVQLALGEWAYKVAGISFVERSAAKLLFGEPPAASYSEALTYFERASRLSPTKKAAYKAALSCQKLHQKAQARRWAEDVLGLPGASASDAELDRLATMLLK